MRELAAFAVFSEQTAQTALDYFNGFHDGNYAEGAAPFHAYDNMVHAEFRNVRDILIEFSTGYLGNSIIGLSVTAAHRRGAGGTIQEPCLGLRLARHYYHEEQRLYELGECQLFTFTDAGFVEQS